MLKYHYEFRKCIIKIKWAILNNQYDSPQFRIVFSASWSHDYDLETSKPRTRNAALDEKKEAEHMPKARKLA